MLWDASILRDYSIDAVGGRLGGVDDFLFSDESWALRWLVVDTGHWLSGRKVLIHPSVVEHPNPASQRIPVKLTREQVEDSPEVSTDWPVSRQMESRLYDYYGWGPDWNGAEPGAIATKFVPPSLLSDVAGAFDPAEAASREGTDAHLRSTKAVTGYHVHARDGEIGHVEDFLIEDTDWRIPSLKIKTTNWWPGERVVVPTSLAKQIDWESRLIFIDLDRGEIKGGRSFDH